MYMTLSLITGECREYMHLRELAINFIQRRETVINFLLPSYGSDHSGDAGDLQQERLSNIETKMEKTMGEYTAQGL
jgi:hypothetical protein